MPANGWQMLNGLDWVLIAVGVLFALRGAWRGAVDQVFGIAGVLAGFWLSTRYFRPLSIRLHESFPSLPRPDIVGLAILFALTWLMVALVGYGVGRVIRRGGMSLLDRFLGVMVGLSKGLLVSTIVVSLLLVFLAPQDPLISRSLLAPYVQEMARVVVKATPDPLRQEFEEKRQQFMEYWKGQQQVWVMTPFIRC